MDPVSYADFDIGDKVFQGSNKKAYKDTCYSTDTMKSLVTGVNTDSTTDALREQLGEDDEDVYYQIQAKDPKTQEDMPPNAQTYFQTQLSNLDQKRDASDNLEDEERPSNRRRRLTTSSHFYIDAAAALRAGLQLVYI